MELSEIRTRIDAVDDQLLKLFLERMELAEEVAAYKNEHHLPILNKQREREILAKVTARAGDKERYAYHLYSTLFELARSRQAELVDLPTRVAERVEKSLAAGGPVFPQTGLVACQGVEGANSQVACDRLLPRGSILYVKTFDAVVSAVESGLCKFGVLPIENSSNGSVRAVYSLLQQHQLSVVRSTRLCIRHELLAMPGVKLEDITEIYSHQQAIGQCSRFLSSLSGVRVIPCGNTAEAAKLVAESGSRHAAAISSHPCAALYGLECVSDKIQDSENNYTRFFCVAKDPVIYAGANRISLILSFENKPGALYEILSKLAALDINMTKLESCPVAGSDLSLCSSLSWRQACRTRACLPCSRKWSAAARSLCSSEITPRCERWGRRFTDFWAESSVTAGRRPFTPRSAVRTIASSSWSRRSWARSSRGRTSAG